MDTSPNRRSLVDTIALRALSVIADRPHRQSLISSRELWCYCRETADVGSVAHIHKGSRTPDLEVGVARLPGDSDRRDRVREVACCPRDPPTERPRQAPDICAELRCDSRWACRVRVLWTHPGSLHRRDQRHAWQDPPGG